jgi:penicillin amidase
MDGAWSCCKECPVEQFDIFRDSNGIPHITSESDVGAFTGLGYAHGKDRGMAALFMRILGQGRVSELLDSSDASLGIDTFFRRMNWSARMENHLKSLTPAADEILRGYCDGLNAAFEERTPWEYRLLGYTPEPWKPEDCILVVRMTGYLTLSQSQAEMERLFVELVQAGIPDEKLAELFPGILGGMDRKLIEQIELSEPAVVPRDLWGRGAPRLMASNNWAVSGKHTASGAALLANDVHLETNRLPNVWYEVVMRAGDRVGIGSTMAGIPGLIAGRKDHIAIGVTYSFLDAEDSWVERCRDGNYYREGEGWLPFTTRTETILRKKKDPVTLVLYENPHGLLDGDPAGVEEKFLLSTQWTGRDAGSESLNALAAVWKADTVEQAMKAMGGATISFNWVLADDQGNIGYQMSGKAPIRPAGTSGFVPLPGWLPENDWQGMVAPEEMPRDLNPDCGYIITANNELNHLAPRPVINMPMGPYRADRIRQLLSAKISAGTLLQPQEMNVLQGDLYSLEAEAFMSVLRPLLPDNAAGRILAGWDCRYNPESQGAYLFEQFYEALRAEVFGRNGFGEDAQTYLARETGVYTDFYINFDRILLAERSAWFADESRDELFRRTAARALTGPVRSWGETRKVTMSHILFGGTFPRFLGFDRGPITLPGCRATVHQGQIYRSAGRTTTFAPSWRFATSMDEPVVYSNLAGGPSDRRFSRWYVSDLKRWKENRYKSMSAEYDGPRLPM